MRRGSIVLVLAILAAFGGAVQAPFHLDDLSLSHNPVAVSPGGWLDCWRYPRPLTWLSFSLNYRLGEAPGGYHLVNLLLHVSAVLLLLSALRRVFTERQALLAAAIFALHPIQTEAVVYVFARATLLMTVFCLLSLRSWLRGEYWTAALWFVPAVLAKEECVAFPLFLLLLNSKPRAPAVAMLVTAAGAGLRVLYAASVTAGSGAGAQAGIAPLDYLAAQGWAWLRYARLLVIPWGFTPESPLEPSNSAAWIVVIAALALATRFAHWRWLLGAAILLAPSSTIFPADDLSADRRIYLPLCALAVWVALKIPKPWMWALPALFALLSFRQTMLWQNPQALWREAIALAPGKVRPRIQLARSVPAAEAESILLDARKIAPDDPRVPSELGRVYLETGKPEVALAEFGRALALAPGDASAVNNRGVALSKLGQPGAARADFRRALSLDPCHQDARMNLSRLGEETGRPARCR